MEQSQMKRGCKCDKGRHSYEVLDVINIKVKNG